MPKLLLAIALFMALFMPLCFPATSFAQEYYPALGDRWGGFPRATIQATITDLDGEPLEGATLKILSAYDASPTSEIDATTTAKGRLHCDSVPAHLGIFAQISHPSHAPHEAFLLRLRTDQVVDLGTIRLAPILPARGRLIGHKGQPIAGAEIFRSLSRGSTYSRPDGSFVIPWLTLPDYAFRNGYYWDAPWLMRTFLAGNLLEMIATDADLTELRLVREDGSAVADTEVSVEAAGILYSFITASNGSFPIQNCESAVSVRVKKGGLSKLWRAPAVSQLPRELVIPNAGSLRVTLRCPVDSIPPRFPQVVLSRGEAESLLPEERAVFQFGFGVFEASELPLGDYDLGLSLREPFVDLGPMPVRVLAGEITEVTVDLRVKKVEESYGPLVVHVVDESDRPVEGALVTASGFQGVTDIAGAWQLPATREDLGGRVHVTLSASKNGYTTTYDRCRFAEFPVRLTVHTAATIHLKVTGLSSDELDTLEIHCSHAPRRDVNDLTVHVVGGCRPYRFYHDESLHGGTQVKRTNLRNEFEIHRIVPRKTRVTLRLPASRGVAGVLGERSIFGDVEAVAGSVTPLPIRVSEPVPIRIVSAPHALISAGQPDSAPGLYSPAPYVVRTRCDSEGKAALLLPAVGRYNFEAYTEKGLTQKSVVIETSGVVTLAPPLGNKRSGQ